MSRRQHLRLTSQVQEKALHNLRATKDGNSMFYTRMLTILTQPGPKCNVTYLCQSIHPEEGEDSIIYKSKIAKENNRFLSTDAEATKGSYFSRCSLIYNTQGWSAGRFLFGIDYFHCYFYDVRCSTENIIKDIIQ